jgi:uncharacterized protein (DUF1810 family)
MSCAAVESKATGCGSFSLQSHWMWFIFPQIAGLGHSAMAQRFAISSRKEAIAYLGHGLLGPRLRECTAVCTENLIRVDAVMESPKLAE